MINIFLVGDINILTYYPKIRIISKSWLILKYFTYDKYIVKIVPLLILSTRDLKDIANQINTTFNQVHQYLDIDKLLSF